VFTKTGAPKPGKLKTSTMRKLKSEEQRQYTENCNKPNRNENQPIKKKNNKKRPWRTDVEKGFL